MSNRRKLDYKTVKEACEFANKVAALTVMKEGAYTSLPSREDLKNFYGEIEIGSS